MPEADLTATAAQQLLVRLRELYGVAAYDPARDITVEQAAADWGVSPCQARVKLNAAAANGLVSKRSVIRHGKRCNVYRAVAES